MCKEYRYQSSAPDPSSYHLKMSEAQYYLHSLPLFTHGLEGFVQNAINECILQGRDRLIALFKRRASSMKFSAPKRCISLLDKRISKDIVGKWGKRKQRIRVQNWVAAIRPLHLLLQVSFEKHHHFLLSKSSCFQTFWKWAAHIHMIAS